MDVERKFELIKERALVLYSEGKLHFSSLDNILGDSQKNRYKIEWERMMKKMERVRFNNK